jgi:singapore isolate B (sub-type 7) whole genome shotgun sequence assembly, scaffold_1
VYVSKGDLITWCFNSLDKDIEFQALFISVDGLMKSLVPLCRVPSKSSLIRGEWKCENDGKVRLVFDNSKSNWLSCSVSYEVNIVSGVKTAATGVDTVTNKVEPLTNEVETATTEVDTVTNEVETINKE